MTEYDSAHPGPFLPKELLERGSPWILLQTRNTSRVAGDFHFRTFGGQSSFEVRMRHPEGRAAGEAYLKALAGFTEPWVYDKSAEGDGAKPIRPQPNPATPQFPPGTMWALVRRAVLADKDGQPVVSPLVESVQVRVYRLLGREEVFQLPAFQKEAEALEKAGEWEKADSLVADTHQTLFEWEMRRGPLLSGGGFHLTGPEDLMHSRLVPVNRLRPVSEFCAQCHSAPPGIHSVQSRNQIFSEVLARPPEFHPAKGDEPDRITKERARFLPGWVLLQWLWKDGR